MENQLQNLQEALQGLLREHDEQALNPIKDVLQENLQFGLYEKNLYICTVIDGVCHSCQQGIRTIDLSFEQDDDEYEDDESESVDDDEVATPVPVREPQVERDVADVVVVQDVDNGGNEQVEELEGAVALVEIIPQEWEQMRAKYPGSTQHLINARLNRLIRPGQEPTLLHMRDSVLGCQTLPDVVFYIGQMFQWTDRKVSDVVFCKRLLCWYSYQLETVMYTQGMTPRDICAQLMNRKLITDESVYAARLLLGRKVDLVYRVLGAPGVLCTEVVSTKMLKRTEVYISSYVNYVQAHHVFPLECTQDQSNLLVVMDLFLNIPRHLVRLL
ncbi:hypothetical protein HPULCUR_006269 [Helicostylum pulchrum]|uniref:Uncharacterized protein n=1 Tax=Helicostylum pulchrum TaxID=562976 RepID=A0ABP9Y291_9FUNG